ncbi:protein phosphatase 1 regulatory subunit 14D [Protopterus annectens]|uniref:protein phosphatase 1 regulatory subunit 14D n=1 Tax=Protopterus annectens TaxID=7888 RepID=UPI001CFAFAFC|nr:protein phosphatase 1 regulatory subunit 14D [Protopterus annectens]
MESKPSTRPRVVIQAPEKPDEENSHKRLGKLTVKYNRKDLQRRLDLEEWIEGQLIILYDCEEEDVPELEIDIDELQDLSDEEQRSKLEEILQESCNPKEEFINELINRLKGLRKTASLQRK